MTYDGGSGGGAGRARGATGGRKSGGRKRGGKAAKNRKAGKSGRAAKASKSTRGRGRPNTKTFRGITKIRKTPLGAFPNLRGARKRRK